MVDEIERCLINPHIVIEQYTVRIATVDSLRPDITARELAKLMFLSVGYTQRALDKMTPEDRALVEANSRPVGFNESVNAE